MRNGCVEPMSVRQPESPASLRTSLIAAMARVCTPVSVVTTLDPHPHGTTVSAFTSLSLDPELILVSLDRGSELLRRILHTERFALNVLARGQTELARRFSRKGFDDFVRVDWVEDEGVPRLAGAAAWIACDIADTFDGGDHLIVVGAVLAVKTTDAEPLIYHARLFGTHLPIAE